MTHSVRREHEIRTCVKTNTFLSFTHPIHLAWGDDESNRQLGPVGDVVYDLPPTWRQHRQVAQSPFGSDMADARIYGSARYNGSFPGVIGSRSQDLH